MAFEYQDEDPRRWSGAVTRRWGRLLEDVHRRLGSGASLEPGTRATFEARLGGDLAGAMVHRGPLAGRLARSLGADALSAAEHVLGDEQLDPSTPRGAGLLGHELMHVLQRDLEAPGEADAEAVEGSLAGAAQHGDGAEGNGGAAIDTDALTERVYQRMMDQLRLEAERGAWIA